MSTQQILPEASRSGATSVIDVPQQDIAIPFALGFTSATDWAANPGITVSLVVDRSLDGGVTWLPGWSLGTVTGPIPINPKTGTVDFPAIHDVWDGQATRFRGVVVCSAAFVWGLQLTT